MLCEKNKKANSQEKIHTVGKFKIRYSAWILQLQD